MIGLRRKPAGANISYFLTMVSAIFLCLACLPQRSYLEPSRQPPALVKTALVRTPSPIYRDGKDLIVIKTINGKPPTFLDDKAIVHPGRHTFQVAVELRHEGKSPDQGYVTRADTSLTFDIEAEHDYLIDAAEDENGVWIWARDLTDGLIVAGTPPRKPPE